MKRNNFEAKFSIVGYILFLIPLTVNISLAVVIFSKMQEKGLNTWLISLFIILYILVTTLLFSLFDVIRRKLMVDRPVEQILLATQKIANGDFKTKLLPLHSYYKYDTYDLIIENINKMTSELSKSEMLKSEFISNVSHEIKTPLSIIQNYAKALQKGGLDKQTKQKYLTTLVATSNKLSNLVTNILKLNKLENQAITNTPQTIKLNELLTDCILQFEPLIDKKNIELNCNLNQINYVCEPSYLELIFNNLISNAVKFTDQNGKINITLKNDNEHIVFCVRDNGCGINKEVGAHIFEKFYQGDTSHSEEGNGLGLALVKRVIDIMGGEISVESQLKKGSQFTVKLKRNLNE